MALQGNPRGAGKVRISEIRQRRSIRRALELAIRVAGADFQGRDFVEDSTTLVVSRHGAKIRLEHQLIPEEEIRILCCGNNRESLFRVVGKAGEPIGAFSFWGVECLKPSENIWEGAHPRPAPASRPERPPKPVPPPGPQLDSKPSSKDRSPTQVMLRCPQCGMRELVEIDPTQIQTIRRSKGLVRPCPACGGTGLWKRVTI